MNPFSPASWLDSTVTWIQDKIAEAITTVLEFALGAAGPVTGGQLFGGALAEPINYAVGVGLWVLPIFVLLGMVVWTARGQPGRIIQLVVLETPLAAAAMLLIPAVATELVGIADAIFEAIVDVAPVEEGLRTIVRTQLQMGPPASMMVLLGAVLMLLGGVVTYVVLLVRSVVIGVSVLIGPMLVATRTWEPAKGIAGKWVALTAMVILIKPVIGFMWLTGWALLGSPQHAAALSEPAQSGAHVMAGAAILLLGGLVPTALFKLVPAVGEQVSHTLTTGLGQVGMRTMALGGAAATTLGGGAGAAGAAAGGSPGPPSSGPPPTAAGAVPRGDPASGSGAPSVPVGAYGTPGTPGRASEPAGPSAVRATSPPPQQEAGPPRGGAWPLRRAELPPPPDSEASR